jgi:hypothetical protein
LGIRGHRADQAALARDALRIGVGIGGAMPASGGPWPTVAWKLAAVLLTAPAFALPVPPPLVPWCLGALVPWCLDALAPGRSRSLPNRSALGFGLS